MICPHCGIEIELYLNKLTRREFEVASALVESESKYKDMYQRLGFSHPGTLANTASLVYKKLGVGSRKELKLIWDKHPIEEKQQVI
jgi:hypothetical protein